MHEYRQIAAEKSQLDLLVIVSFLAGLYAIVCGTVGAVTARWWAAATFFLAGLVVSGLCYRAAVSAAVSYGVVIRSAYDIHRFRMLDALDWSRPTSWSVERAQWRAVTTLWLRGAPASEAAAAALGYPAEPRPDDGFWRRLWTRVRDS